MLPYIKMATRRIAGKVSRRVADEFRPRLRRAGNVQARARLVARARTSSSPAGTIASAGDIESPSVCVVIPARNEQEYLSLAIESVLTQDLSAFECIVVDDGSVDYTLDVAAELAETDRRVRVVRHSSTLGVAAARNTGLVLARAPHITFLDADDYLFPGSLSARSRALAQASSDVIGVYCDWMQVREVDPPMSPDRVPLPRRPVSLASSDGAPPSIATAPLVRTDAIRAIGGFDETFRSAEDFELWMRVLRAGYSFEPVEHIGVAYRQRRTGMVLGDPANHAIHMAKVFDRADHAAGSAKVAPALRAESLVGSAVFAAATNDPRQLRQILELVRSLPADAFTSSELSGAARTAAARVRKAVPSSSIVDQVDSVLAELWAAVQHEASHSLTASVNDLGPISPLDDTLTTRAIRVNRPDIRSIRVNRGAFGGVVLCPLARYHVDELVPLADELRKRGHRVSFLLAAHDGADIAKEMRKYGESPFTWPSRLSELGDFTGVVTLNDWGPVQPLIHFAGERNIPSFSKVEGVQDFEDVDTGRLRKPYRWTDHVLCQGPNDVACLAGRSTHIVGNSRLERIALGPERTFCQASNTVVINSNFTYNVLTDARVGWLESALKAVADAGATPLISQHHADRDLNPELPIAKDPLRKLFFDVDILVSRFSTVPFEAMAHGVPFVYHNPHGELVPAFNHTTEAFRITRSAAELTIALHEALTWRGEYRERSRAFFSQQVDIDPQRRSEERAAEVVDRVLSRRP